MLPTESLRRAFRRSHGDCQWVGTTQSRPPAPDENADLPRLMEVWNRLRLCHTVSLCPISHNRGRIPASKGKISPAETLTPNEFRAPAARCSTTSSYGIRHRALIVLLYRTGLRIGEALALRPKNTSFEIGLVTVLHGKGNGHEQSESTSERRPTSKPGSNAARPSKRRYDPLKLRQIWMRMMNPAMELGFGTGIASAV